MKLLAIHTGHNKEDKNIHSVDLWRLYRPLRELKKHVDWQIDERPTIMKHIEKYKDAKDFTEEEFRLTYDDLKQYDVIWASYTGFMHPAVYALTKMLADKEGVKFILDIDDNVFKINPHNVGWWMAMSHDQTWDLQTIVRDAPFITTTNEYLANELRQRKVDKKQVEIIPNFISLDYDCPEPNNEEIVIGYFGGASHYDDIHHTHMTMALEKVMHEHKNVYFKTVGMPVEDYLPKKRFEFIGGQRGHAWVNKLFPSLQFDIALGPLTDTEFNYCKSDIKWQESAMMGAAFIGSNVKPYKDTVKNGVDGLLVDNTFEDWYKALTKLVEDAQYRKQLARSAKERVKKDFLIENNWQRVKDALESFK